MDPVIAGAKNIFAQSAKFQSLVAAADSDEALTHIFEGRASDDPNDNQMPTRAVVVPMGQRYESADGTHYDVAGGEILVSVEITPADPRAYKDSDYFADVY